MTAISADLNKALESEYSDIYSEMKKKGIAGDELCDYMTWSYYNAVPLQGDDHTQEQYRRLA